MPLVLIALGIDKELNIDFGSWESWSDEIQILMNWARNYKSKPLF